MSRAKEKLKEVFESTIEFGNKYDGGYENIDYYSLFYKAASQDQMYKLNGNNMCMFNYSFEGDDSVMILFSIPLNPNENSSRNIADRVMDVIANIEECFITVDYTKSEEVKEDKVVYITSIKRIGEKNER
jgi:hypothetical protein